MKKFSYNQLKAQYDLAEEFKQAVFVFNGEQLVTKYARYLLVHLATVLLDTGKGQDDIIFSFDTLQGESDVPEEKEPV